MLNQSHPLYQLADKIDWEKFETAFQPLYCQDNGRPGKPIRLMCGLLILKHLSNLSDESLVEQWSENAYYQYFLGAMSFRNEYDGHTIESSLEQVEWLTGRKIKLLAGDRGYRGKREINGTKILIPEVPKKSDSRYQRSKKHKLFCKRAGIEPTIGHLKSDYRLSRNFYKGVVGDTVNILIAAAAYNFKRAMKDIVKDVVTIYNEHRPLYSCGYLTPEQMHRQSKKKSEHIKKQHTMEPAPLCVTKKLLILSL